MEIKTTKIYHFTSTRMAIVKKIENNKHGEDVYFHTWLKVF